MCEHPQPSHSPASPVKGSRVTESLLYYYLNTVCCINAIFLWLSEISRSGEISCDLFLGRQFTSPSHQSFSIFSNGEE